MQSYRDALLLQKAAVAKRLAGMLLEIPGVKDVGVFGSYAHGTFTDRSDLDIYILFDKNKIDLRTLNKQVRYIDWTYFPEEDIDYYFVGDKFSPLTDEITKNRISLLKGGTTNVEDNVAVCRG